MDENIKQIIYALQRQVQALQRDANRRMAKLDYSAEFPDSDAQRLREAIAILSGPAMNGPYGGFDIAMVKLSLALGHPQTLEAVEGQCAAAVLIEMAAKRIAEHVPPAGVIWIMPENDHNPFSG